MTARVLAQSYTGSPEAMAGEMAPGLDKGLLGLLIFLGTEVMFFAGLISAFLILRAGSPEWPPFGQPRLPVEVTAVNTVLLLFSGFTMHRATRAIRQDDRRRLTLWLLATAVLGVVFLGVQGVEWLRLVHFGLTVSSSNYGATFYTLIGAHGLHVLAAVLVVAFVLTRAAAGRYSMASHTGVELCQLYWLFVVGVWPVLYVLVYLS